MLLFFFTSKKLKTILIMAQKKTLIIEKKVLKNYLIQSPSKVSIEKKNFRNKHFKNRERLFFDCLKLPKKLFHGSTLLDFGCGTGEHDISYAKWGSKLTLIDINPVSTNQVKKYFTKFKLKKFKAKNYFVNSGQSIVFDSNLIHRSGPSLKGNNSIRYTMIARYKNINKILN